MMWIHYVPVERVLMFAKVGVNTLQKKNQTCMTAWTTLLHLVRMITEGRN